HYLVVAAARAIRVEVRLHHFVVDQPFAGRRSVLDRTRRRNMVGRDRVAEDAERARSVDADLGVLGLKSETVKKWRLGDVGRLRPRIHLARDAADFLPKFARVRLDLAV